MTFAPSPQPRYTPTLSSSEVALCTIHKAKSGFVGRFSQMVKRSVMWQSPGKFTVVFGVNRRTPFNLPCASRIAQLPTHCKLRFSTFHRSVLNLSQLVRTCVRVFPLRGSEIRRIMVLLTSSLNEKRRLMYLASNPRTSHNVGLRSNVMSLRQLVYHAMPRTRHEKSLNVWGIGS